MRVGTPRDESRQNTVRREKCKESERVRRVQSERESESVEHANDLDFWAATLLHIPLDLHVGLKK